MTADELALSQLIAVVMLFLGTAFLMWLITWTYRQTRRNKWRNFGNALRRTSDAMIDAGRSLMEFGGSLREFGQQLKAVAELADFAAPGQNLPLQPRPEVQPGMCVDKIEHDDDGVCAIISIPKHQLPPGWFISDDVPGEPMSIEKEDDEIPLHIRVAAGELLSAVETYEWNEIIFDLDWHEAEYSYMFWNRPSEFATLRLSFSRAWFHAARTGMRDEARDRAIENKRGET